MERELYFDIRIPESGNEFEHLTQAVCTYKYGESFTPYGRNGQCQHGIDLFSNGYRICIQCKNYQGNNAVTRLLAEIKNDFLSAVNKFQNSMKTYILATTVRRDTVVQDLVYQISRDYPEINVEILFWEDFQEILRLNPGLIRTATQYSDVYQKQYIREFYPNPLENLDSEWFASNDTRTPIKWGYNSLDTLYKLSPGSIVLLAGYSDVDTSILAQNIVRFNLKQNAKIIYFNLKESANSIVEKFLAAEGVIDIEAIRSGQLREEDWQRLASATSAMVEHNILFSPFDVTRSISDHFLSAIQYGHADLVVLDDFAGLCLDPKHMSTFLYRLRSIASKSSTYVLVVMDLPAKPSRVDTRPLLSDSQISEMSKFCDVVQFLYHDEHAFHSHNSISKELELITAKYYSSSGSHTVYFIEQPSFSCMVEYEKNNDSSHDWSEKYPGLIAGATLLSKIFEQL